MDVIALSRYKIPSPPFSIPTTNSALEPWQAVLFWWAQKAENSIMAMKIEYLPTLESRQANTLGEWLGFFWLQVPGTHFPLGVLESTTGLGLTPQGLHGCTTSDFPFPGWPCTSVFWEGWGGCCVQDCVTPEELNPGHRPTQPWQLREGQAQCKGCTKRSWTQSLVKKTSHEVPLPNSFFGPIQITQPAPDNSLN